MTRRLERPGQATIAAGLLSIATASSVIVASSVMSKSPPLRDRTQAEAIRTSVAWVREHVPPGATVAFAEGLAWQTATELIADYRLGLVTDEAGLHVDAAAPLGVRSGQEAGDDDWIALRASGTDVNALYGYRARIVVDTIKTLAPRVWILGRVVGPNPYPMLDAVDGATGVIPASHWSWPFGKDRLEITVFIVDPQRVAFPDRTVITQEALARIIAGLERSPRAGAAAAASLAARAVVIPNDPTAAALLDRLRHLAAPAGSGGGLPSPRESQRVDRPRIGSIRTFATQ